MRNYVTNLLGLLLALSPAAFAQSPPPPMPPPPSFVSGVMKQCFADATTLLQDGDLARILGEHPLSRVCGCVEDGIRADAMLASLITLSESDLENALKSPTLRTYAKAKSISIRYTCIANAIERELAMRRKG